MDDDNLLQKGRPLIMRFRQPLPQPGSNGHNRLANENGDASLDRAEAPARISFSVPWTARDVYFKADDSEDDAV